MKLKREYVRLVLMVNNITLIMKSMIAYCVKLLLNEGEVGHKVGQ